MTRTPRRQRPLLVHLTTVDLSLAYLLLPQLIALREAGYDVVGVSAPGEHVATLEANGIRHVPLERSGRLVDRRQRAPACPGPAVLFGGTQGQGGARPVAESVAVPVAFGSGSG